jgi:hypothetical protein
MIGVQVQPGERETVSEFFELFKTPWEFCREGAVYEVVVCTQEPFWREGTRLVIIFSGRPTAFDKKNAIAVKPVEGRTRVDGANGHLPLYGVAGTFPGRTNAELREEKSREPAAFFARQGDRLVLRAGYNLFEEAGLLLSKGQPAENAETPTLEMHIALLRNWITGAGIPLVEIPPVPEGHAFIACLTHDIDHPVLRNHWCDHTMFGFLYRATFGALIAVCRGRKPVKSLWRNWAAAGRLPFVRLGLAKDFWKEFDRYLEIDGEGGTYFVIPKRDYAGLPLNGNGAGGRACRYTILDVLPQLKNITAAGGEIGLHGIDAWQDAEAGRREQTEVTNVVGVSQAGVRMHWLYFDSNSPAILDQAGFGYDSTVGFNDAVGYRAGATQAYRPPGATRLLELPLHVMDTALFYPAHLNLDETAAEGRVWGMMDDVERFGGALTINWHDRSIAPERLWDGFYLKLVAELRRRGAWMPTGSQATAWFRKRRAASVEVKRLEGSRLQVKGCAPEGDQLPGLIIRIHKPGGHDPAEQGGGSRKSEFVDVALETKSELSIAI